jgi:hypothetical protein
VQYSFAFVDGRATAADVGYVPATPLEADAR